MLRFMNYVNLFLIWIFEGNVLPHFDGVIEMNRQLQRRMFLSLPTPYLFWQCLLYEKVHLFLLKRDDTHVG